MKVNWISHTIELFVVIIGISIAFALNSWNEGRKEAALERQFLQSFVTEMDKDLLDLEQSIDTFSYYLEMNNRLLALMNGDIRNTDSIFHYLLGVMAISEFHPHDNTYESLKVSGNLNIIRNFDLRFKIIDLYNQDYPAIHFIDGIHKRSVMEETSDYINQSIRFGRNPRVLDVSFLDDVYFVNKAYNNQYILLSKIQAYKDARENLLSLKEDILGELK